MNPSRVLMLSAALVAVTGCSAELLGGHHDGKPTAGGDAAAHLDGPRPGGDGGGPGGDGGGRPSDAGVVPADFGDGSPPPPPDTGSSPVLTSPPPLLSNQTALHLDQATLAAKVAEAKANSPEWAALKGFVDSKVMGKPVPDWSYQGEEQMRHAASAALVYRILKAMGSSSADRYGQKARALLLDTTSQSGSTGSGGFLGFTNFNYNSGYGIRYWLAGMAYAHSYLTSGGYAPYTSSDQSRIKAHMRAWISYAAPPNPMYREDTPSNNFHIGYMVSRVLAGIVLGGQDYSNAWKRWKKSFDYYDSMMGGSGHSQEGTYAANSQERLMRAVHALQTATGKRHDFHKYTRNLVLPYIYGMSNDGQYLQDFEIRFESSTPTPDEGAVQTVLAIATPGSFVARLAARYLAVSKGDGATYAFTRFLFARSQEKPHDMSNMPLSHNPPRTGPWAARSSWSGNNGTLVLLNLAGDFSHDKSGRGGGDVVIRRDEDLLYNAAYSSVPLAPQQDYNSYQVFGIAGGTDQNVYNVGATENPISGEGIYKCPNADSYISRVSEGGRYAYAAGRIENCWGKVSGSGCQSPQIGRFSRSLLFVRPGLVLINDVFVRHAGASSSYPRGNWHFKTNPTVSGNRYTINNKGSRLQLELFAPAGTTTTVGRNNAGRPGFRLQFTPKTAASISLLSAFRAGDNTSAYAFPTMREIKGAGVHGVAVEGLLASESNNAVVGVFADSRDAGWSRATSVKYSYTQNAATADNYVGGLKPSTRYAANASKSGTSVTVDIKESSGGSVSTDAGGVLYFQVK